MLSCYRVLDLTDEKGFFCGKMLADLGADVIKIEKPGGDTARNIGPYYHDIVHPEKSLYWMAFNTNKRGITLDIEAPEGGEIFKRMAKTNPSSRRLTLFLVPFDIPGISVAPINDLGNEPTKGGIVSLENVRLPGQYLPGGRGRQGVLRRHAYVRLPSCFRLARSAGGRRGHVAGNHRLR
jgi:hypothetical protein